jgi:hypothetical protein
MCPRNVICTCYRICMLCMLWQLVAAYHIIMGNSLVYKRGSSHPAMQQVKIKRGSITDALVKCNVDHVGGSDFGVFASFATLCHGEKCSIYEDDGDAMCGSFD